MRYLTILIAALVLASCATKVPYTNKIKKDFGLDEQKLKGVQFYTSQTIILEKVERSGSMTTESDGDLVVNESKSSDRVIIPVSTPCIFEKIGDDGDVQIRFETGSGKVLHFKTKANMTSGRFYLVAQYQKGKGKVEYGNEEYSTTATSANAYLMVKLKKWQNNKRKDRVVRGMKV